MYYDFLENNKKKIVDQLDKSIAKYKVQPVGNGYIDCIVMKDNLDGFIKEISDLGILISNASWWCYVYPNESNNTGCPHGMGGPSLSIMKDGLVNYRMICLN